MRVMTDLTDYELDLILEGLAVLREQYETELKWARCELCPDEGLIKSDTDAIQTIDDLYEKLTQEAFNA